MNIRMAERLRDTRCPTCKRGTVEGKAILSNISIDYVYKGGYRRRRIKRTILELCSTCGYQKKAMHIIMPTHGGTATHEIDKTLYIKKKVKPNTKTTMYILPRRADR